MSLNMRAGSVLGSGELVTGAWMFGYLGGHWDGVTTWFPDEVLGGQWSEYAPGLGSRTEHEISDLDISSRRVMDFISEVHVELSALLAMRNRPGEGFGAMLCRDDFKVLEESRRNALPAVLREYPDLFNPNDIGIDFAGPTIWIDERPVRPTNSGKVTIYPYVVDHVAEGLFALVDATRWDEVIPDIFQYGRDELPSLVTVSFPDDSFNSESSHASKHTETRGDLS